MNCYWFFYRIILKFGGNVAKSMVKYFIKFTFKQTKILNKNERGFKIKKQKICFGWWVSTGNINNKKNKNNFFFKEPI